MKLHLGCGEKDFGGGWLNVDVRPFGHVDKRCKPWKESFVWEMPGVKDASVEMIYSSHMLQYYDWEEGRQLCSIWREKLIVGGVLRLSVVDFGACCGLYANNSDLSDIIGPLYGRMRIDEQWRYAKCVYDSTSLTATLMDAGFQLDKIRQWTPEEHAERRFRDCSCVEKHGVRISLNLEAER